MSRLLRYALIGVCFELGFFGASAVAQPCPCDGDVNHDSLVDITDVLILLDCRRGGSNPSCDIDCDGAVTARDLGLVIEQFQGILGTCGLTAGACCLPGSQPGGGGPGCIEILGGSPPGGPCQSVFFGTGIYAGDGIRCTDLPCDCNQNGLPDACDVSCNNNNAACNVPGCGMGGNCNQNETLDECEFPDPNTTGRCCFVNEGIPSCAQTDAPTCMTLAGVFGGPCSQCPAQNVMVVVEPGGQIFVHVIGPPVNCNNGMRATRGTCNLAGPFTDAWQSPVSGLMCHTFGVPGSPALPAGFFNPGSDPFTGTVCLTGSDLGNMDFPGADTLIERSTDPFPSCTPPSPTLSTVAIQIVALSLTSTAPITVTYNGGQNPESWDTFVDLSVVPAPAGTLTAVKTHCEGGTYTSMLNVQPRFVFTKVASSMTRELDTGLAGIPPVSLVQGAPEPWVTHVDPNLPVTPDHCSAFHAGIDTPYHGTECNMTCQLYGDVVATCMIDVDDILLVLAAFGDPAGFPEGDIFPCGGNGILDVDDILAELDSFSGNFLCAHPCAP